jgi:glycosyltransferase involved in cell wall biosynthesis
MIRPMDATPQSPRWSFLVACRNVRPFVAQCLDGCLTQTEPSWEAVIVDDASDDGTAEILAAYVGRDARFRVVRQRTQAGYGAGLHLASTLAVGALCGVLDGDDWLYPEAAKVVGACYDAHPDVVHVWTKHDKCMPDGCVRRDQWTSDGSADLFAKWAHGYSHWRTFRRSVLARQPAFDPTIPCAVDKDQGLRLDECGKGMFLPDRLYVHRLHAATLSAQRQYSQHFWHGIAMERARVRRGLSQDAIGLLWRNA